MSGPGDVAFLTEVSAATSSAMENGSSMGDVMARASALVGDVGVMFDVGEEVIFLQKAFAASRSLMFMLSETELKG